MAIRIMLVDDRVAFRQTVRLFLDNEPDLAVVAEASDGETALRVAHKLEPDVALVDVIMPGMNGIEATRRLVAALPSMRVLALTMHADSSFVQGMLEAGATGYVLKDSEAAELIRAIRLVADGETYLSSGLDDLVDPASVDVS